MTDSWITSFFRINRKKNNKRIQKKRTPKKPKRYQKTPHKHPFSPHPTPPSLSLDDSFLLRGGVLRVEAKATSGDHFDHAAHLPGHQDASFLGPHGVRRFWGGVGGVGVGSFWRLFVLGDYFEKWCFFMFRDEVNYQNHSGSHDV